MNSAQRSLKDMMDLTGRVALITGGAGYIGRAVASGLKELGATVVTTDICDADIDLDLQDGELVKSLPSRIAAGYGGLDILVHCAAYVGTSDLKGWAVPFEDQTVETWRTAMEVNLTSFFTLVQAATPYLKESGKGSVIAMSSIYGMSGPDWSLYEGTELGNPAAYGASKGGLLQFVRWLSSTLGPDIRINAVSPGGIARGQDPDFVEKYEARTPLGRMGREDDITGAVAYLASDLSAYVTGQNLVVDGGWTAW